MVNQIALSFDYIIHIIIYTIIVFSLNSIIIDKINLITNIVLSLMISCSIVVCEFFVFSVELQKEEHFTELQKSNTYDIKQNIKEEETNKEQSPTNEEFFIEYSDANHLYVPPDFTSDKKDLGYYYLMPEKWFNNLPVPPICLTNDKETIKPVIEYNTSLKTV